MTSSPSGPAPFALRTLGSAALLGADGGVVLGPGKPLALLAYLALEPRRSATRDHLLDLLWGDLDPEKARHALRQTLWYLKQVLGPDALAATRGEVTLALPLATDVERFLAAVRAGELEQATALYTGSFLGEFAVPGGVEFEHWADIERQRNRAAFLSAADALVRRQLATGRHREAQQLARRARDEARGNEAAWRLLLEAHAQAGDHLGFSMEASSLAVLCAAEGREPEPATRALLRRLERQDQLADPAGAARTLTAELVGREREFAVLVQAWQELGQGGRHVHVTAPAGLGKTRLLHDLHERLRSLGARVLLLRANPGEGSIGYALLGRLATELATLPGAAAVSPASAGTLVALSPLLSSRYAATPDAAAGEEALRRRADAVAELLAVVSDERPVAVLLDDAHWLDAASRSALRSVLERLGETRALVITASRLSGPASMAADGALVLPLHPLSAAQVLALVGSLGSVPAAPWGQQLPAALARATGGSPLLILETLQLALEAGWLALGDGTWSCPDPAGLGRRLGEGSAIRHRVTQLEHPARLTLLALALAGTPLPAHLVAPATGLAPEAAEAALAALEQRGLVTRAGDHFQPAHDEIAAASQDLADAGSVADLHAGLGRTLAGSRRAELTDLARAGRHLHLASRHAELVGVFSRYLRRLRAQGDGRRVVAIAYEFLGEGTPHDEVAALVRRLPLVTRVLRSSVRGAVTAGMLALLLGVLAFVAFRPEPATLAVIAVEVDPAGRWHYAGVDLTSRTWATGEPLQLAPVDLPDIPPRLLSFSDGVPQSVVPAPDFRSLAFSVSRTKEVDTGIIDFYMARGGNARRLTWTPRDDAPTGWSPDGQALAGISARWSPPDRDDYDVVLWDTATGAPTRLTYTTDADLAPEWAPDGQRIGFLRQWKELERPASFCWIRPGPGQVPTCIEPVNAELTTIAGWIDPETVNARLDSMGSAFGVALDVATGQWRHRDIRIERGPLASPRGEAELTVKVGSPGGRPSWEVRPTGRPDAARMLIPSRSDHRMAVVSWRDRTAPRPYLDTLRFTNASATLARGGVMRLGVAGRDGMGRDVPIRVPLDWRSSNPAVLRVSEAGILEALVLGTATITAEIPGWRQVSTVIRVTESVHAPLLNETWDDTWTSRWQAGGAPAPRVVTGPGGIRGFLNNGDGSYASGAVSRQQWDPGEGLGLEAQLLTPVTESQFQLLNIYFAEPDDQQAAIEREHGLAAALSGTAISPTEVCGIQYPYGEGNLALKRMAYSHAGSTRPGRIGPWIRRPDRWWTLRIQVFPDGRCGVAVNGRPVWLSAVPRAFHRPWRLELGFASQRAQMLHGPMRVWRGVPTDIDWSALDTLNGRPLPLDEDPAAR